MKFILSYIVISLLSAVSFAQEQVPGAAKLVIESYIANHCKFVSDYSLENVQTLSVEVNTYPGFVSSVKKIDVKMIMTYGNDDFVMDLEQTLALENITGNYRITAASGPCVTIIKFD